MGGNRRLFRGREKAGDATAKKPWTPVAFFLHLEIMSKGLENRNRELCNLPNVSFISFSGAVNF